MSLRNRRAAFRAVETHHSMSVAAKLLLVKIGDLVADGGYLEASAGYLADSLGESRSSVRRWLKELADVGLLHPTAAGRRGQGRTSTFELRWCRSDGQYCRFGDHLVAEGPSFSGHLVATHSEIPLEEAQNRLGTANYEPVTPLTGTVEEFIHRKALRLVTAKVESGQAIRNFSAYLSAVKDNNRQEWEAEWFAGSARRALEASIDACPDPDCKDGYVWTDEDTRSAHHCRQGFSIEKGQEAARG